MADRTDMGDVLVRKCGPRGMLFCVTALLTVSGRVAPAEPVPTMSTEWAHAIANGREASARWRRNETAGLQVGPWHASDSKSQLSPAEMINLTAMDQQGKPIWRSRPELIDGVVHYDLSNHGISTPRYIPQQDDGRIAADEVQPIRAGQGPASLFLVRTIESPEARSVAAWLGAERGLDVWLNGRRVFADARMGNGVWPDRDQAQVRLPLNPGENQLVLRFLDVRRSGFYFSLVGAERLDSDPSERTLATLDETFPIPTRRAIADTSRNRLIAWLRDPRDEEVPNVLLDKAIAGFAGHAPALRAELEAARGEDLVEVLRLYDRASHLRKAWSDLRFVDFPAMRRALADLAGSHPDQFGEVGGILRRLAEYETRLPQLIASLEGGDANAVREVQTLVSFRRQTLLANPLLDFDQLLLIRRTPLGDPRRAEAPNRGMGEFLGLPQQSSWQLDRIRQPFGWRNDIAVLTSLRSAPQLRTLYRPPIPRLLSDIDLNFDADKLLFSMPGEDFRWRVFELDCADGNLRQVTAHAHADVDDFDACYLPNGKLIYVSTAAKQGVPCSDGIAVAVNYLMDADGTNIRRLGFDQDHDYCPTVMNDGRVMYLRWDYTDLPHQWPRILFSMNPDGTSQRAIYGSNSYWPNAIFYARAVPDRPTMVAGIVMGHHVGRVGELVLFDTSLGQQEADGVVQRIPGWGETVEPIIMDKLAIDSWPKFVHPYPLSDKYFIVSAKPGPDDLWGIYLVDVFDNMVLLHEMEGESLFEPIPLAARPRPPVIPERTDAGRDDAVVYLSDIYQGEGLRGVPRGTIKRLRIFAYYFAYPYKSGGQHRVGTDGPWEPKRILGAVPVESDGSASFRIPANTPISIQALDADGAAVQLMRSWTTAMPGEVVSCVGCHGQQNRTPSVHGTMAGLRGPAEIEPWHGPTRGFSFQREVQPVLDAYCVSCHDGNGPPDLRGDRDAFVVLEANDPRPRLIEGGDKEDLVKRYSGVFPPSYYALRRFVRVGGLESDLHVLPPGEFHADTTELIQMLRKGHYGVQLDDESWGRLAAWIDLNAPCHGAWQEVLGVERTVDDHGRRRELESLCGYVFDDPEQLLEMPVATINPLPALQTLPEAEPVECPGWPFPAAEAIRRQERHGGGIRQALDLGDGLTLDMVRIPAGTFVMGAGAGSRDERPRRRVEIPKAFWISRFEVTNQQFARFNPTHDSRHEHGTASFNSERAIGPPLNGSNQPVVRISWNEASAFCDWASNTTGVRIELPTEPQWEYACRAGAGGAFHWGDVDADFSPFANMADATLDGWATYNERRRSADQVPRDARFDDQALVTADVGSYLPNPWGLHDMQGNASEWTRSTYGPYTAPAAHGEARKVVRGGSWYDRPKRCGAAFRWSYPAWRKVFNVGFRVVCEDVEDLGP